MQKFCKTQRCWGNLGRCWMPSGFSSYQAIWAGQYQDAQAHAYRALQLAQKNADSLAIAGAYQNLSFAQIESGQYHAAYQISAPRWRISNGREPIIIKSRVC